MDDLENNILEKLLTDLKGLDPVILRAADEAETSKQLPKNLLTALHKGSFFKLLLPKPYGGLELSPFSFCQIIQAVGKIDASTAWCLCQANGCAMSAAFLPPEVAEEIWAKDQEAALAWGPGGGEAIEHGNYFQLTGSWSFVSGGRHATWIGGHAKIKKENGDPRLEPNGQPTVRTFIFPASQARMTVIWDVIGLLGTGSDQFSVSDILVPKTHMLARDNPNYRVYEEPLYLFPAASLYASGFAGVALGIAAAVFDSFKELVITKTPRLEQRSLDKNTVIQSEVGQAQARLNSAKVYLLSELKEIWMAVRDSRNLSIADRMRIRLASTYAIHESRAVVDLIYAAAGATAIFSNSPFQRRFRDIHTVAQQVQGRKSHFQTVGSYLLGHPPDLSMA